MLKTSWTTNLCRKLVASKPRAAVRRRSISTGISIERLERRQLLSATAVKIGSETQANTYTAGDQNTPATAMDSAGDYVIAWQSTGGQDGSS